MIQKIIILILFLLISINVFAQKKILFLFDYDDQALTFTFSGSTAFQLQQVRGTGAIVIKWGDGTQNSYTLTGSDQTISHTYANTNAYNIVIDRPDRITKWFVSSNAGTWNIDFKKMKNLTFFWWLNTAGAVKFNTSGRSMLTTLLISTLTAPNAGATVTVNTADIPSVVTLRLVDLNAGTISLTINTADIPSVVTLQLQNLGTGTISITVNTANIPSVTTLQLISLTAGTISITVNTANIPSVTTLQLNILNTGTRIITANPADITAAITYFAIETIGTGAVIDLSYTTKTWANNQNRVAMNVPSGGLTSCEIDQLFSDLAGVAAWTGNKVLAVTGTGNAQRTTASDAAKTTIQGKGVTVTDKGNGGTCP